MFNSTKKAMQTPYYTVFGNPIAHSKSPDIHQLFAQQEGISIHYTRTLVDNNFQAFQNAIHTFFQSKNRLGANITLPFKEFAYQIATQLSPRAKAAKAVNTFILQADGCLVGDNTDGIGLVQDLQHNLNIHLNNKTILILGAGGAARGVILPLLKQQPKQLTIANRTYEKARILANEFSIHALSFSELSGSHDIIINATSSSIHHTVPAINPKVFSDSLLAYDMFYSHQATSFMQFAQQHGSQQIADGLGMLVGQAAAAYYQWRGFQPNPAPVIATLRHRLAT